MPDQKEKQPRRHMIVQDRARLAWDNIDHLDQEYRINYASRVKGLPAMIQVNGLAVTIAFLNAKRGADEQLAKHLATRILQYLQGNDGVHSGSKLMEFIREASTDEYRRATAEAIEFATWLKRYVEAKGWEK